MDKIDNLKDLIKTAFGANKFPKGTSLSRSGGDEPKMVREAFEDKHYWQKLEADFIDQAPEGLGSALSFFSRQAFRFYIPAYMIHDLDGNLLQADPLFHLTHGLTDSSKDKKINPKLYGDQTWMQENCKRFELFTKLEVFAIITYLEYKMAAPEELDFVKEDIQQALTNYWELRQAEL